MERARSAPFPRVLRAMYFGVKVHHFKMVHFFSCVDSGENQGHQDLVKGPGY